MLIPAEEVVVVRVFAPEANRSKIERKREGKSSVCVECIDIEEEKRGTDE